MMRYLVLLDFGMAITAKIITVEMQLSIGIHEIHVSPTHC